ncbi:hypothetical protein [Myxococcus xanthus]|uniref:hypothetical protein n=1 Tax=Myxococcus xanthus TaxID=34 RepID=UPI0002E44813|nr:hypothetical protein [Myxococcus xanthus]NOJ56018.1 hypothetical protein [Myxococcus xanthus]QPM76440.1 hypothetical protein I5Q59_18865 [Myxococcus xanthus]QVW65502.1 hypothetical protein JTM82_24210 [Myxococcus xanthus DZ2]QZZ51500.1 hypothetical protein MyxoNM_20075 [Myxococcus xanthus]UEO01432.1 hypothetical protein K1515_18580 [Myxococcus xanthus DZ2]
MLLDMYLYFGLPLRPAPRRAASQASQPRTSSSERTATGGQSVSGARAPERKAAPQLTVIEGGAADIR